MWDFFFFFMIKESFTRVNIVNVPRSHLSLCHRLLLFWNRSEVLPWRSSVSSVCDKQNQAAAVRRAFMQTGTVCAALMGFMQLCSYAVALFPQLPFSLIILVPDDARWELSVSLNL